MSRRRQRAARPVRRGPAGLSVLTAGGLVAPLAFVGLTVAGPVGGSATTRTSPAAVAAAPAAPARARGLAVAPSTPEVSEFPIAVPRAARATGPSSGESTATAGDSVVTSVLDR